MQYRHTGVVYTPTHVPPLLRAINPRSGHFNGPEPQPGYGWW